MHLFLMRLCVSHLQLASLLGIPSLLLLLPMIPPHLTGCGLKTESFCRLSFRKFRHCVVVTLLLMQLHLTVVIMLIALTSAAHLIPSCLKRILVTSGSMRLSLSSLLLCSIICTASNCHLTVLLLVFLYLAISCQFSSLCFLA